MLPTKCIYLIYFALVNLALGCHQQSRFNKNISIALPKKPLKAMAKCISPLFHPLSAKTTINSKTQIESTEKEKAKINEEHQLPQDLVESAKKDKIVDILLNLATKIDKIKECGFLQAIQDAKERLSAHFSAQPKQVVQVPVYIKEPVYI